jgi:hypothetical protein
VLLSAGALADGLGSLDPEALAAALADASGLGLGEPSGSSPFPPKTSSVITAARTPRRPTPMIIGHGGGRCATGSGRRGSTRGGYESSFTVRFPRVEFHRT